MVQELVLAIPGVRIARRSVDPDERNEGVFVWAPGKLHAVRPRFRLPRLHTLSRLSPTFGSRERLDIACVSGHSVPLGRRRATGPSVFVDCFDFIISDS